MRRYLKRITRWQRALLAAFCLLLLVRPVKGQEAPPLPEATVTLAWEGRLQPPGWTEVQFTFTNEGPDWEGELRLVDVANQTIYHQALSLPAHSNKFYRVPLFVSSQGINIVVENATSTLINLRGLGRLTSGAGRTCAIVDPRGQLALTPGEGCDKTVAIRDLQTLPETSLAWDQIDVLIINGAPTDSLTPAQQGALLAWVSAGGHLVVGGSADLPQALSGLPEALAIAAPGALITLPAPPLSLQMSGAPTAQNWQAAELRPAVGARALLSLENTTLAASENIGLGRVDILGWNLGLAGGRLWLSQLWSADITPATSFQNNASLSGIDNIMAQNTAGIPIENFPKTWWLLLIIPVYILLMGPFTLLIVRRLRKPVLAWILLPGWIVLTVLGFALGLNSSFAHAFPIVHEIGVILIPGPGLPARAVQTTAIYAPGMQRLAWDSAGLVRPLSNDPYAYASTPDNTNMDVTLGAGESRLALSQIQGVAEMVNEGSSQTPEISATLAVTRVQSRTTFTGQIWSAQPLHNVRFVFGSSGYWVPLALEVPAGEAVSYERSFSELTDQYRGGVSEMCAPLDTASSSPYYMPYSQASPINLRGCYLVGTIDTVPFPLQSLSANHITESCVFYALPCPQSIQNSLSLSSANAKPDSNSWIDSDGSFYVNLPSTTLTFLIPEIIEAQTINAMTIQMESGAWTATTLSDTVAIALWDWEAETWREQPASLAITSPLFIADVQSQHYINSEGLFQIRLTPTTTQGLAMKLTILLRNAER